MSKPTKLRVLHILEATVGGTKKHVLQLLRGLPRDKYEIALIASTLRTPSFEPDAETLRSEGIPVYIVQMHREIRPLADLLAVLKIWAHLLSHRYEIVHTHSSKAGAVGRIAALLAGGSIIVHTPHAFPFLQRSRAPLLKLYEWFERFAATFTDMLIAVSRYEKEQALTRRICRRNRVCVIENGLSEEEMKLPRTRRRMRSELGLRPSDILVGSAGRLSEQKAYHLLVEAAARLAGEFPRLRFAVAGMGTELLRLERLIIEHRLGRFFNLLGECKRMRSFYAAMDIFVLPSLWEGLPYALIEAMAAGKPVAVSNVCGMDDIIQHGKNGLLFEPNDAAALAEAIRTLVKDALLRRSLGRQARLTAQRRFKLSEMLRKIDSIYQHLAAKRAIQGEKL